MTTTKNRSRINDLIAAQAAFNRKSSEPLQLLREGWITTNEYEQRLADASEKLEEAREALKR